MSNTKTYSLSFPYGFLNKKVDVQNDTFTCYPYPAFTFDPATMFSKNHIDAVVTAIKGPFTFGAPSYDSATNIATYPDLTISDASAMNNVAHLVVYDTSYLYDAVNATIVHVYTLDATINIPAAQSIVYSGMVIGSE